MKISLLFLFAPSFLFAQNIYVVPLQPGTATINVAYKWIAAGTAGSAQTTGITKPESALPYFRISTTPPANAEALFVYDSTDEANNWNDAGYVNDRVGYSLAASQHVIVDSGTITTLTNLPSIPSNWITAAGIAANALNGKGDWLLASNYMLYVVRTGTAQSGSTSTTIKLDSGASSTTDFYTDAICYITGGTGVGQSRFGSSYDGTTKILTVDGAWSITPDNTSTFAILPTGKLATVPVVAAGVRDVNNHAPAGSSLGEAVNNAASATIDYNQVAGAVGNIELSGESPSGSKAKNAWKRIK